MHSLNLSFQKGIAFGEGEREVSACYRSLELPILYPLLDPS
jgi:hypothetical protein